MTVTKWLHVDYIAADPWVLPIWTAVSRAAEGGRVDTLSDELGQLGLHVSTRLSMIETLIRRINTCARRLEEPIATREPHHEFTAPDSLTSGDTWRRVTASQADARSPAADESGR